MLAAITSPRRTASAIVALEAEREVLEALEQDRHHPGFGWRVEDGARAFDEHGVLCDRLPLRCSRAGRGELQLAFAHPGVAPHIPVDVDDEGDAFLRPDVAQRARHLAATVAAFDALRAAGIEAEPCSSITRTSGFAELAGNRPHGAIFWHKQHHDDAFDADGDLAADLQLHWRGDRQTIARVLSAALCGSPLEVVAPDDESTTFTVTVARRTS